METFKEYLELAYDDYYENYPTHNYYIITDLIDEILKDKDFPETNDYSIVYYYLKGKISQDYVLIELPELFNDYLDYLKIHGIKELLWAMK